MSNTLTYKDGILTLIVDGTEISTKYIVDPMHVIISPSEKPTVHLEVLVDELNIEELTPVLTPVQLKDLRDKE